jgi:hypothetical protein
MSKVLSATPVVEHDEMETGHEAPPVTGDSHITPEDRVVPRPPNGAVCNHCLSNELAPSRNPGLFIVARLFGYKVYRCRRCLTRSCW